MAAVKSAKKSGTNLRPIMVDVNEYGVETLINSDMATVIALYVEYCKDNGDIVIRDGNHDHANERIVNELLAAICESFAANDLAFQKWYKEKADQVDYEDLKQYFLTATPRKGSN